MSVCLSVSAFLSFCLPLYLFLQNYLLFLGGQSFVLLRSSSDWVRPTHMMEGHPLYPNSTYLNVRLKNNLTEMSRTMFDQVFGHHDSFKWTLVTLYLEAWDHSFLLLFLSLISLFGKTQGGTASSEFDWRGEIYEIPVQGGAQLWFCMWQKTLEDMNTIFELLRNCSRQQMLLLSWFSCFASWGSFLTEKELTRNAAKGTDHITVPTYLISFHQVGSIA